MLFFISSVCEAFNLECVGSSVLDHAQFFVHLTEALEKHDISNDRVPGQHYIVMPAKAHMNVSSGVGRKSSDPKNYVLRAHRGVVSAYLRREFASPVEGLAVVVYTVDAYVADPDVSGAEIADIKKGGFTHVIVAVLASAGPTSHLTPHRFVHNLAGGNNEALTYSGHTIREMAKGIRDYYNAWSVVAD